MPAARGAPAHGSRAEAPVSSTRRSRQAPEMRQEEGEPWEAKEPRARVANAIGAPPTPRRQAPKAAPQRAAEDTVMDTPRDLEGRGSADTQWPLLLSAPWCRGRRRPPRGVWLGERPISSRSPTAAPFLLNPERPKLRDPTSQERFSWAFCGCTLNGLGLGQGSPELSPASLCRPTGTKLTPAD